MRYLLSLVIVAFGISCFAAIPVRQAAGEKQDSYLNAGVFVGGRDRGPLSLLNVRHSMQSKSKMERIVFDVGEPQGKELTGRPGFFHASIEKKPNRIVLDLENVTQSKVTLEQIARLFFKSPFLGKPHFYFDPINKGLTIELPLKISARMEVFELASDGKPGRIVMDIKAQ